MVLKYKTVFFQITSVSHNIRRSNTWDRGVHSVVNDPNKFIQPNQISEYDLAAYYSAFIYVN